MFVAIAVQEGPDPGRVRPGEAPLGVDPPQGLPNRRREGLHVVSTG